MSLLKAVGFWLPWFLIPELTAVFWKKCPWPTLSGTFWLLTAYWHPIAIGILACGIILIGHFDLHWSAKYLIIAACLSAIGLIAHLAHFW